MSFLYFFFFVFFSLVVFSFSSCAMNFEDEISSLKFQIVEKASLDQLRSFSACCAPSRFLLHILVLQFRSHELEKAVLHISRRILQPIAQLSLHKAVQMS